MSRQRLADRIMVIVSWTAAIMLIGCVSIILGYLIVRGIGHLNLELIFGNTDPWLALTNKRQVFDGILSAIVGTVILVVLSVGIALPLGIFTGIYLSVYASKRIKQVLSSVVDVLASVPSIVIGLFGLAVIILLHSMTDSARPSLLLSALTLSCLVLPYIIRSTELSIDAVDPDLKLTAQALGASKFQNTMTVLIPNALSGILSGSILAIGRSAEDTAVIMLTGAVASSGFPDSLFSRFEAIPFFIYYTSAQYTNQHELMQGYSASIVLLFVCVSLFLVAYLIKRRFDRVSFLGNLRG